MEVGYLLTIGTTSSFWKNVIILQALRPSPIVVLYQTTPLALAQAVIISLLCALGPKRGCQPVDFTNVRYVQHPILII